MVVSGELDKVPLLDVLQVLAYAGQSGSLSVEGERTRGTVLFEKGGILCAGSAETDALLSIAAEETDPGNRRALRRIQALASLTLLLSLRKGVFRFKRSDEPCRVLGGVSLDRFHSDGALDTGELLLVLTTLIDQKDAARPEHRGALQDRAHPRYGPTTLRAELRSDRESFPGFLSNLSEGGAFFSGEVHPAIDDECQARFQLPGAGAPVECRARVVWARADETGRGGVGISFIEMSASAREVLRAYLNRFHRLAEDYLRLDG